MSVNNTINWFESAAYDHPDLHSPQQCPRGVFCQYKIKNPKTGQLELACCRMVHPGEEGTGERRMFSRATSIPLERCATVRLTGGAKFYERRYNKIVETPSDRFGFVLMHRTEKWRKTFGYHLDTLTIVLFSKPGIFEMKKQRTNVFI